MYNQNTEISLHQLVEFQVSKTPDAVAVIFREQELTYRELNQKANQLAHYLKTLGVKPEVMVGICVERSLEMIIALLGVLKAGGVYVPLDPAYPAERLAFMIEDSKLCVLLTQQNQLAVLPKYSGPIVLLDADSQRIAQQSKDNLDSGITSDNLAYTIYTSGSTGKPKGVQIIHSSVVNFLLSMQQEPGITAQDIFLAVTTICFDIAVLELFLSLTVGARIVIASRKVASDAIELSKTITKSCATVMQATPATWRMLLAIGWQGNRHLKILCGGEALTRSLANQLLERSSSVWNMYGPTETTIWSTVHQVEPGDNPVSIGRPILNNQIFLLKKSARRNDDILEPVPNGCEGEVYIGGIGLARGYLNRPKLTSERFINDPFRNEPTARLYKTGDLARYLPDGNISIIGRIDHQIKIRGYRIELGDIEAALSQHSAVQECIVIPREDSPGDRRLVAYVVLKSQPLEVRPTQLRSWLKEKLPDYMVPALVVFMNALPLTPNNKVDRRALPVPNLYTKEECVPPRTKLEKQLTQIWTSVLGVEIGIYQDFFESGGDSLRTALLLSKIQETFQVELSLDCLFKAPTIAGLAAAIQVVQSSDTTAGFETTPDELQADAILERAIRPIGAARIERQHIFLTGVTGFIGAFLLPELLRQNPQATVYCLIRADNLKAAVARLRKSLESYEFDQEVLGSKIVPIVGDLSHPLLGLSEPQFQELADRIDVIYHSGAYVNLVYPYTALRGANVVGTQEVLRLATEAKTKPVHYISTLDVFQSSKYKRMKLILETDELLSSEGYSDGYSQSKWVAEKLVMVARERGLPVCIYRLGMITGHSQTGAFPLSNLICRMIKGFIQSGQAPKLELKMNLAPVDYVARAIEHLSRQPESCGKTFHLLSSHILPISQLISAINALGYAVTDIPYQQWLANLLALPPENALTPMVPLLTKKLADGQQTFLETSALVSQTFDSRNTQIGLAGTDIICPPISFSVLETYWSYFIRRGFLPKPSQFTHTS